MNEPAALSPRAARRERLARLREQAEPLVAGERRAVLRLLLQHPLLTPDGPHAEAFAPVRRHREYAADWFAHSETLLAEERAAFVRRAQHAGRAAGVGEIIVEERRQPVV